MWLRLLLLASLAVLAMPAPIARAKGSPGVGRPVWPKKGQLDHQLYDKAMRIQARMWWHLSPEGLLAEIHRVGADQARLSHDALRTSDAAIWTGCYAASQACRWRVTRDPDALRQVRHLARGLTTLTSVTGTKGRLARSAGRPIHGERRRGDALPSPRKDGLYFKSDVSRDQLAGVTLGWYLIWKYVEEPDLRSLAARQMREIALRLRGDGMWLRDHRGRKTKHGELRPNVKYLPFFQSGSSSAIGLAAVLAATEMNSGHRSQGMLASAVAALDGDGWDEAVSEQHTNMRFVLSPSNVNMSALALTTLSMSPHRSASHHARLGLHSLRRATVGWWNAGICSCFLLGNPRFDRKRIVGEIRGTLHAMPEQERPPARSGSRKSRGIAPVYARSIISGWTWKEDMGRVHTWPEGVPVHPTRTYTRADWLFAYWLARAAGELEPKMGPGAEPTSHRCPVDVPPWMRNEGARR